MKKYIRALIMMLCVTSFNNSIAQDVERSKKFVESVMEEVLNVLKDEALEEDKKKASLEKIFKSSVNTDWIGKFVLGRHFKSLNDENKKEYLSLYGDFIASNYVLHFKKFRNQKIKVTSAIDLGDGDVVVKTEVRSPQSPAPLKIDYLVRSFGDSTKVLDIIAEGVRLIATQRHEFAGILSQHSFPYLIEMMKKKIKQNKSF